MKSTYSFVIHHFYAQEKPVWEMDTHEKIEACEKKKGDGNLTKCKHVTTIVVFFFIMFLFFSLLDCRASGAHGL